MRARKKTLWTSTEIILKLRTKSKNIVRQSGQEESFRWRAQFVQRLWGEKVTKKGPVRRNTRSKEVSVWDETGKVRTWKVILRIIYLFHVLQNLDILIISPCSLFSVSSHPSSFFPSTTNMLIWFLSTSQRTNYWWHGYASSTSKAPHEHRFLLLLFFPLLFPQ